MNSAGPGRVLLRDVRETDLPVFFEQQQDPVATQMAAFPSRERAAFMAHWGRVLTDPTVVVRTILYEGQVAGNVVSFVQDDRREVGYWLGRAYWGRGITTQALAAFLAQVRARPLYAHVAKHNVGSRRVLEKCGFVVCGEATFPDADGTLGEEFILVLPASPPATFDY
jgi:RimJ/RimL family protein N-acetyltransferase